MRLVITVKPLVAQNLVSILGANQRMGGYLESGTWRSRQTPLPMARTCLLYTSDAADEL